MGWLAAPYTKVTDRLIGFPAIWASKLAAGVTGEIFQWSNDDQETVLQITFAEWLKKLRPEELPYCALTTWTAAVEAGERHRRRLRRGLEIRTSNLLRSVETLQWFRPSAADYGTQSARSVVDLWQSGMGAHSKALSSVSILWAFSLSTAFAQRLPTLTTVQDSEEIAIAGANGLIRSISENFQSPGDEREAKDLVKFFLRALNFAKECAAFNARSYGHLFGNIEEPTLRFFNIKTDDAVAVMDMRSVTRTLVQSYLHGLIENDLPSAKLP